MPVPKDDAVSIFVIAGIGMFGVMAAGALIGALVILFP